MENSKYLQSVSHTLQLIGGGRPLKTTDPAEVNLILTQLRSLLLIKRRPHIMSKLPDKGVKLNRRIEVLMTDLFKPQEPAPVKRLKTRKGHCTAKIRLT